MAFLNIDELAKQQEAKAEFERRAKRLREKRERERAASRREPPKRSDLDIGVLTKGGPEADVTKPKSPDKFIAQTAETLERSNLDIGVLTKGGPEADVTKPKSPDKFIAQTTASVGSSGVEASSDTFERDRLEQTGFLGSVGSSGVEASSDTFERDRLEQTGFLGSVGSSGVEASSDTFERDRLEQTGFLGSTDGDLRLKAAEKAREEKAREEKAKAKKRQEMGVTASPEPILEAKARELGVARTKSGSLIIPSRLGRETPTEAEFLASEEARQQFGPNLGYMAIGAIPIVGTIAHWNHMSTGWKVASIALDAFVILGPLRGIGAMRAVGRGTGQNARTIRVAAAAGKAEDAVQRAVVDQLTDFNKALGNQAKMTFKAGDDYVTELKRLDHIQNVVGVPSPAKLGRPAKKALRDLSKAKADFNAETATISRLEARGVPAMELMRRRDAASKAFLEAQMDYGAAMGRISARRGVPQDPMMIKQLEKQTIQAEWKYAEELAKFKYQFDGKVVPAIAGRGAGEGPTAAELLRGTQDFVENAIAQTRDAVIGQLDSAPALVRAKAKFDKAAALVNKRLEALSGERRVFPKDAKGNFTTDAEGKWKTVIIKTKPARGLAAQQGLADATHDMVVATKRLDKLAATKVESLRRRQDRTASLIKTAAERGLSNFQMAALSNEAARLGAQITLVGLGDMKVLRKQLNALIGAQKQFPKNRSLWNADMRAVEAHIAETRTRVDRIIGSLETIAPDKAGRGGGGGRTLTRPPKSGTEQWEGVGVWGDVKLSTGGGGVTAATEAIAVGAGARAIATREREELGPPATTPTPTTTPSQPQPAKPAKPSPTEDDTVAPAPDITETPAPTTSPPAPGPKPTPEPDPVTTPEPDPVTTPEPEPDPVTTPEPDPVTTPEPDPVTTPDPDPVTTPDPDPVTTPEPDPVTTPDPDPVTTPDPDPVTTPEPDPVTTPEPDPVTTPEPDPVTTPDPDPVTTPDPDPVTTPEPEPAPPEPKPKTGQPKPTKTGQPTPTKPPKRGPPAKLRKARPGVKRRRAGEQAEGRFPEIVAYKRGMFWRTIDMNTGESSYSLEPPLGVPDVEGGSGAAKRSFRVLSHDNDPPSQRELDAGAMRVTVDASGPRYRPKRRRRRTK